LISGAAFRNGSGYKRLGEGIWRLNDMNHSTEISSVRILNADANMEIETRPEKNGKFKYRAKTS
jgi:hypothetical protein